MQQNVALESEYTGQTYGESDVEIRTRVEGWVLSMNFKEGSMVKKGPASVYNRSITLQECRSMKLMQLLPMPMA